MDDKAEDSVKQQSPKTFLIIGAMWVGLGLFGLIFDPTKKVIIFSQLVLGSVILAYSLWLKLK